MRTSPLTNRGLTLPAIVTLVLLMVLAALVAGASAVSAQGTVPDAPDRPTGTAVFIGGVDLEWNEVPGADPYGVQMYRNGQWTDLPGDGIEIAFYGAGAIISELDPDGSSYWFRLRAGSAHGFSEWSDFNFMAPTNQSKSGRRARPDNVPASGTPLISGTAQVGESLTADTTGIEDGNGLDRVQFRFQWVSHDGSADTDIANATDSTYTLVADDAGKTIKVRVSFTDRGGYAESLTSEAMEAVSFAVRQQQANSPSTGTPAIIGTAQVGDTLTADTTGIADTDGLTNVSYSYKWIANDGTTDTDIAGATDSTYTLVAADEGQTIKVGVSFTDDAGNGETRTSTATSSVAARPNSAATGAPTISGTSQVGETLTAATSGIGDADGLTNVSYSYQWIRSDGTSDADITDATDSTFTLVAAYEGMTIKVRVSFTDDAANEESLTSAATGAVAEGPPSHITVVVTEDRSDPNNIVTNFTVTWRDSDGCSTNYNAYLNINPGPEPGHETGSQLHLGSAPSDGAQITKGLTGVHGSWEGFNVELYCGTDESGQLVSKIDIPGISRPMPGTYSSAPLTALTIGSGALSPDFDRGIYRYTAEVPSDVELITLDPVVLTGFQTDIVKDPSGYVARGCSIPATVCTDWSYGDGTTYGIVLSDADTNTLGFQVNLDRGENRLLISVNKGPVPSNLPRMYDLTVTVQNSSATGAPAISGTAQVGETLTAATSGISDADGLDNVAYSYQWLSSRDMEISGATNDSYALVSGDEGKYIKVRVTFTDDAGYKETLTSAATGAVAERPNSPTTGVPTIGGTARVGETLTADTTGITDADGLDNATFSYQWLSSRDTEIQGATGAAYILVPGDAGKTIKVRVSFTDDAGNEESLTSAATATVASSNPTAGICDRTEQVQDAILGMLNGVVDDCADVTDSHLAGITIGLRISNGPYDRQALSLQSGDFAGLVNIEQLAIYNHTMDALPEDVFDGLGSLESLDLGDNEIAALPEGVFDGLGSLESLDLSGNEIAALPEDVFDGLGSLEWLDLSDNEIPALPEDVFDGLGSLEWLDLSHNEIAALPEDVFDGLGSLESLDLGVNQIGTLPEDVFDGLGSLRYLELSGNRINALPEDVFDGLGNLKYLRLSFNDLSALPDYVFDDLGNLVHLDVQENQIGTLSEGAFNGLSSLGNLDLSYNEIAALPEDVFDGLGNLKS